MLARNNELIPMPPKSPLLHNKKYQNPPVSTPDNLLREARRQKPLRTGQVPRICILDPDGDVDCRGGAIVLLR